MRPWSTLLAFALLVPFAARPALAAFAHGLSAASTGGALVTAPPDESSLLVENIGSSGQDGVDVTLPGVHGHRFVSSSTWSSSDDGVLVNFSWRQVGGPVSHDLQIQRTATGITLSGSLFVFGGLPESRTLMLFLGDDLVHSRELSSSGPLELQMPPAVSSTLPVVDLDGDAREDVVFASVLCPSPVTLVLDGSVYVCDRVAVRSHALEHRLEAASVRVTNPPGGSFSSLTVSSQGVSVQGSLLVTSGRLHLSAATLLSNALTCEIGSQGEDGVTVTESLSSRMCVLGACGSGGGGGGGGSLGSSVSWSSSRPSSLRFPVGSLVLRPGTDADAALRCDVLGSSSCSPDGVVARLRTRMRATDVVLESRFSSMCADQESVIVSRRGASVLRAPLSLDGSVVVSSPPGSPLGMAINEKGLPGEKGTKKPKTTANPFTAEDRLATPIGDATSSVVVGPEGLQLHVSFADARVIEVGGTLVVGDDVTFQGRNTMGGGAVITLTGSNFGFERSSTGSLVPSSVEVQQFSSSGGDQVYALAPPGVALSSTSPVVHVPVVVARDDTSPMRGYSVQVELSPELVLAGPVVEYDYLSSSGSTQMFVVDDGSGRHTVDCVILGPGCGPGDEGTLFTVPVSAAPGVTSGTGRVVVVTGHLVDCDNNPLASSLGSSAHIPIDFSAPSSVSLSATQVTTGNGAGSTTRVLLTPGGALQPDETLVVYRAPFGNYPEYDDGPAAGSVPTQPGYPPPAPWSQVSFQLGSLALEDHVTERDFYYYTGIVVDRFGNPSLSSSLTSGTLSYHLGDVSDGVSTCTGDNQVGTADISALGSSYGTTLALGSPVACLDVGPTSNGRVSGRPLTDNRLSFEDLIMFAINFSLVSQPADRSSPAPAAANALTLELPALPAVGETFEGVLRLAGAGDVLGLSATLDYDASVVELLGASEGELLSRQGRSGVVLHEGRHVDAALLGDGAGFSGEGELARVRFRVRAPGDPRLALAGVDGRDAQNQPVWIGALAAGGPAPARPQLRMAFPDPFDRATNVVFSLRTPGRANVAVFDVTGRLVRTLADGVQPAGVHTIGWDGRRHDGTRAGAGVYVIRLQAEGVRESRAVRLVP